MITYYFIFNKNNFHILCMIFKKINIFVEFIYIIAYCFIKINLHL